LDFVEVALCPGTQCRERLAERATKRRQLVLNPWRNFREGMPRDDAVALKGAEGVGEDLATDPLNSVGYVAESEAFFAECDHNERRPLVRDPGQRRTRWAR